MANRGAVSKNLDVNPNLSSIKIEFRANSLRKIWSNVNKYHCVKSILLWDGIVIDWYICELTHPFFLWYHVNFAEQFFQFQFWRFRKYSYKN